jgi:hypothetical protein
MNRVGENFSLRFLGMTELKNLARHELSFNMGNAKRTGISNPLCSTNESLRTAGHVRLLERR